jgi:hypothetical protein
MATPTLDIDFHVLDRMDLRNSGQELDDYTVVEAVLISAEDHEDLHSAVIRTPDSRFVRIIFQWIHWSGDYNIYDHTAAEYGLAPREVFPKTITKVIYE